MDLPSTWIPIIQNRVARAAIGASTARGQRAPGLVAAAREHLAKIDLTKFSESRAEAFSAALEKATRSLEKSLPKRGRSFGIARKMLNIFLRDALLCSLSAVALRSRCR